MKIGKFFRKKTHNKSFFLLGFKNGKTLFCYIVIFFVCSCSNKSSKYFNQRNQNQYYQKNYYQPQYYDSNGGSKRYVNPYEIQNQYRQNGYDFDQFYVAPTQYKNIEPQTRNVILDKY